MKIGNEEDLNNLDLINSNEEILINQGAEAVRKIKKNNINK